MVVFVTSINSNSVINIMLGNDEMLRILVPISIEENLVKDDISEENNSPIFTARPPC